jgi:hypothetical protein
MSDLQDWIKSSEQRRDTTPKVPTTAAFVLVLAVRLVCLSDASTTAQNILIDDSLEVLSLRIVLGLNGGRGIVPCHAGRCSLTGWSSLQTWRKTSRGVVVDLASLERSRGRGRNKPDSANRRLNKG